MADDESVQIQRELLEIERGKLASRRANGMMLGGCLLFFLGPPLVLLLFFLWFVIFQPK